MLKRAVLYARVSSDDRGKDGRNLAGQLEMCREYAQERGYEVIHELAEDDRGASGAEIDLPQLTRVRDMASAGEFDVLVVREMDRLSRNLAKQIIVEQELTNAGVAIEYVVGDYADTPEGRLSKNIKAVVAEFEREKINERTRRALRRLATQGRVVLHGGKPPYGYRRSEDRTTLEPYEPEARIVRLIFEWYTQGDESGERLPSVRIAERLTQMRVPTWSDIHGGPWQAGKKRQYGEWSPASVLRILRSELYLGKWHYGKRHKTRGPNPRDRWICVDVPALVSAQTWEEAQGRRKRNKILATRNLKNTYLMHYRLSCARCGRAVGALTTRTGGRAYPYYFCYGRSSHRQSPAEKCDLPYFRADRVDAAVWEWLTGLITDPTSLADGLREQQAQREAANRPLRDRVAVVEELLSDNRRQLDRLLDLYLKDRLDTEMLVERQEQLQGTIEALERERRDLERQLEAQTLTDGEVQTITEFASQVRQGLDVASQDFEARRRLVELLDVQARLEGHDGEKTVLVQCMLGGDTCAIVPSAPSSAPA